MQALSLVGASFILWAFLASSYDKMDKNGVVYGLLNFVGAAFLALSLIDPLNLGALILETVWSLTGLLLVIRAVRKQKITPPKSSI